VNVVIAPLAIIAGFFYVHESKDERAKGLDFPGVATVTVGLLALVFGIIEASRYGWWKLVGDRSIGGWQWPSESISPVPVALAIAAIVLAWFVQLELSRVRAGKPVVFDFTDLVHKGFRYGLINTIVLAMGEFGAFFVLPIFLQAGRHLTAISSGTWLLPAGAMAFIGGGIGGQLSKRFGPKYVITVGLAFEALGIWLYVAVFSSTTTFLALLPGLMLHGIGIGFATSQLTNVVLSDIPPQKAGSASGAAGMVRQVGTALGIALIGAIFVSQATSIVSDKLAADRTIPEVVRRQVVAGVADGVGGGGPPKGAAKGPMADRIEKHIADGVADASRPAVAFAGAVVTIGALLSLLVPNIPAEADPSTWSQEGAAAGPPDPEPEPEPEPSPA
jgi:hypothetical protein